MTERAAVSGSSGFIGSSLSEYLISLGLEVRRLGREGEVVDADYYFDLGSYGNKYGHTDVAEIYRSNVNRAIIMALNALDYDYKAYLATSSQAVLLDKKTDYSKAKKIMESKVLSLAKFTNRPISVVRPLTVTGVGDQAHHLIPKLIHSAFTQTEMPFVSKPRHDFIDIDDLVEGLWTIATKNGKSGEVYEIGSGEHYSNEDVAEIVGQIVGRKPVLRKVINMRSYDTNNWQTDNSKLRALGWKPKKNIVQSIDEMVEVYAGTYT